MLLRFTQCLNMSRRCVLPSPTRVVGSSNSSRTGVQSFVQSALLNKISVVTTTTRQYHRSSLVLSEEIENILKDELNQILIQPDKDMFDTFLNKFKLFKLKQTESGFDELDEIASLIQDLRQLLGECQNINQYDLEMALSSLSQHCLHIDLNFFQKAREDILSQISQNENRSEPEPVVNGTTPKKTNFWNDSTTKHSIYKLHPFLEPRHKQQKHSPPQQQQQLRSHLTESVKQRMEHLLSNLTDAHTFSQPLKSQNFLKKQYDAVLTALKENDNSHNRAAQDLGMTPRQLSSLVFTLSRNGFDFEELPPDYPICDDGFLLLDTPTALNASFEKEFTSQRSALVKMLSSKKGGLVLTKEETELFKIKNQ